MWWADLVAALTIDANTHPFGNVGIAEIREKFEEGRGMSSEM